MSIGFDTTDRFLRPSDVGRIRRNQRRIQIQSVLVIGRNVLFAGVALVAGLWGYRQTQSDARFAVRHIELAGLRHTPRAAIDPVVQRYAGLNLFQIDITRVQQDLGSVSWIRRIEIEKKLPDTLRIKVVERVPVALLRNGSRFEYVDETGVAFSMLSPEVGDGDLPVIAGATGDELRRTVRLLRELSVRHPELYSRLAEIQPIPPRGFAVFDRELGATVYANSEDIASKWRTLYAIVRAEGLSRGAIEYADLRFADRIIVRPVHVMETAAPRVQTRETAEITN